MKKIKTSHYSIYIGRGVLSALSLKHKSSPKVFILTDENTHRHCLPLLLPHLHRKDAENVIMIHSGEKNKTIRSSEKILKALFRKNADRQSLLINLGGGMICDLGGFAASVYKRGIDFIHLPTTLLSQADAAIGGKTGINFLHFKNQIGTFTYPKGVFIEPRFLHTLSARQLLSGFAEIVKHGLIADKNFWKELSPETPHLIREGKAEEVLFRSIEIKNKIIIADPLEKGIRKILNFGHTIGHALETASMKTRKPLLHGEAVAIGMICEAFVSSKVAGLKSKELDEITSFLFRTFSLPPINVPAHQLTRLMEQDKKNQSEKINFTLLSSIGKARINQTCNEKIMKESLQFFNAACRSGWDVSQKNQQRKNIYLRK